MHSRNRNRDRNYYRRDYLPTVAPSYTKKINV